MRCLEKNPNDRYSTMDELMVALRRCEPEAGSLDMSAIGWGSSASLPAINLSTTPTPSPISFVSSPSLGMVSHHGSMSAQYPQPSMGTSGVQRTVRFSTPLPEASVAPIPAGLNTGSHIAPQVVDTQQQSGGSRFLIGFAVFAVVLICGGVAAAALLMPWKHNGVTVHEIASPPPPRRDSTASAASLAIRTGTPGVSAQQDAPLPSPDLQAAPQPVQAATQTPTPTDTTQDATRPLMLRTDPAGARVRRDGGDIGDTPLPLLIPQGEHWTIEISKEGFETRTVTVEGGQPELTIHLDRDRRPVRGRGGRPNIVRPVQSRPVYSPPPAPVVVRPAPQRRSYTPDLNDPWARER
jgi:hypothetical protein